MKSNTISEVRSILDVFEQGKQIQRYEDKLGEWLDIVTINTPCLDFCHDVYRVKPEKPKKWRPFNDVNEFIAAAGGLGAIWLNHKTHMFTSQVTGINYAYDYKNPICIDSIWLSLDNIFERYTFIGGRPCGVEEDA